MDRGNVELPKRQTGRCFRLLSPKLGIIIHLSVRNIWVRMRWSNFAMIHDQEGKYEKFSNYDRPDDELPDARKESHHSKLTPQSAHLGGCSSILFKK